MPDVTFLVSDLAGTEDAGKLERALTRLEFVDLVNVDPEKGLRDLPDRVGMWPAAGWLTVFTWLELVFPDRAEPQVVGGFLVAYLVVNVWLGLIVGERWFAQGDGFEVWFSLVAWLAVLGRRNDGVLVVRNPLDGVIGQPVVPGWSP